MDNIYYDGNLKASLTVGSVSDINPLNAYTKDQVNELLGEKSDINHTHEQYLTEHQDISHLASKEEIPSIKGLATEEYVNNQIDNIDIPKVDLSNCATKEELNEVKQSVSEGKKLIASAITDLGIPTLATDTWETMANNIRSLNPYYIEYTIEAASPTDIVDDQKYIPNIKNMGDTELHRNYDAIVIKLNDGTTTSDLNTYAKDVSKITIYYNEKTEQIRFRGSMFTTVYVKEVNYIKTDNFITLSNMFLGCRRLQRINNMDKWITDNVTEMNNMFCYCTSLTSLDLSNFNTSNVTSMASTFSSCSKLTSLDLSNFDTSKVTYMGLMFQGCSSLKTLKLSNFNTQNVLLTNGMFQGCTSLEVLDLSSFNTIEVNTFSNMLSGVPTNVDWCYDETNYANWTLTEEDTGFSGTFPWNVEEETVTLTLIFDDPSTGEEIHREIIEYPKGTEVNTYDICSTISIEGYKHGTCDGGTILTMDEDKEYHTSCFKKEDTSEYGTLTLNLDSKEYECSICGYTYKSANAFRDSDSPTGYKCLSCQSILIRQ